MGLSYDTFTGAFLEKITEFEFMKMISADRTLLTDDYLRRAVSAFKKNCKYNLSGTMDNDEREFGVDVADEDLDELVDIISEGMVVQWLKPYVYQQENLENAISTRDYSVYSPAELLKQVGNAYKSAKHNYTQAIREYSYNHGDLSSLHL